MENQTKKCTKCLRELSLENFRWKNKAQGKKHSQCKDCQKAQEKIHYQESSERRQAVLSTAQQQKQINLEIVNQFKSIGCQKCGEKRIYLLDCHHINPNEKNLNICTMSKSSSPESIQSELKKCIVLCSVKSYICHDY